MQLFLQGDQVHSIEVPVNEKISFLKNFIEIAENLPQEEQLFFYGGKPLQDDDNISDCLVEGATVDVSVRLRGGKVHGSLARAGKVKGQTPKVEKQEKKKKKTGRAKRRMQYNRVYMRKL